MKHFHQKRRAFRTPLLASVAACLAAASAGAGEVDLPRYPALSPDGSTVVFSWRGDLWSAASTGGGAVRLTSGPGDETRSAFTPEGDRIVFESDRDGLRNLWIMSADGTGLAPLTTLDAPLALSSVGLLGDEPVAFLDTTLEGDLYRSARPYVVPLAGGTPRRLHDAFGSGANASPSGAKVLFERGGARWSRRGYEGPDNRDLWLFDPEDGSFVQLTEHPGNDGFARFIDNGSFVYLSDRGNGSVNLHKGRLDGRRDSARRITDFDGADIHGLGVSADGRVAVLSVLGDLWRLDLGDEAAKPVRLSLLAPDDAGPGQERIAAGKAVSEVALSPDGKTMAFVADGDVFVRATEDDAPTRRVSGGAARERDLCWSPDGLTLYFVSDCDESEALAEDAFLDAKRLSGSDSIFAATVAETREEARTRGRAPLEALAQNDDESKAEEKTDEKAPDDSPDAEPATGDLGTSKEEASEESTSKENASDKTSTDEGAAPGKKDPMLDPARWADPVRVAVRAVTTGPDEDRRPVASPTGDALLFTRNSGDLMRLDLATGETTTLRDGWDDSLEFVYSPDGSLIAFAEHDLDFNKDVWVMPADGSSPAVNVTRHPDNDGNPRFSADGRMLAFLSERNGDESDAWVVMLDRDLDGMAARDLDAYFKEAGEAAKKRKPRDPAAEPTDAKSDLFGELELDDAYLRVRRVTTMPGSERQLELTPAGDKIVFTGGSGRDAGLFVIGWDGRDQKRLGGSMQLAGLTLAGDRVIGLSGDEAKSISLSGDSKSFGISADNIVDLAARNEQKLREVSRLLGGQFYTDPAEKGLDWPSLTEQYADLASRARTADEFDFIANMFVGFLDGSHLGVRSRGSGGPSGPKRPQGRLGVTTAPAEAGLEVVSVLPRSPAALANPALEPGDVVTSVDFVAIDPSRTLESHLEGRVGEEVLVGFERRRGDGGVDELLSAIVPVSSGDERMLRYEAETSGIARKVHELSGGRLGYIHIRSMDQPSLDRFERDLYAAVEGREGLLIDVRNNGGGWTTDRLLASIDAREHAYTVPRGGAREVGHYPQDRLYIQRYTLPKAMLCNEKSFSNAEIISHAFRNLGIGPLIGQRTSGSVISTGAASLVDGTSVRMPFRGWYVAADGRDMEENGAMPDFIVVQTPEDESAGRDAQLEKAVEELMRRLPRR